MSSPEEPKGAEASQSGVVPNPHTEPAPATTHDPDAYPYEDSYSSEPAPVAPAVSTEPAALVPAKPPAGGQAPPPSSSDSGDGGDDEDDGMLRMSFMEHLEELRTRLIRMLMGMAVAFVLSLTFTSELWNFVRAPAAAALKTLGFPQDLVQISPMEAFNVIWLKLPVLCSIFIASPWILYQIWAFIAPGLYPRERRWAAPFVICSAGLFILGGVFAYFVAFRFGLTFLLGIGRGIGVSPMVSITEYFDLFVNVILGVGLVFELPVLIFFLSLLRIVTPGFLLNNSRYAILLIFIVAAIVTPTPDVFNLMLFATPMVLLFYVGIFASYLLLLQREGRKFPWKIALIVVTAVLLVVGLGIYLAITRFGFRLVPNWPFILR